MKGIFTVAMILFFFSSCKESGVPLSMPSTFVKYYSDGNQDEAIDILETSDKGYLVLSHSDSSGVSGIIITKTDIGGNALWQKSFAKAKYDFVPSNFVAMKDNAGIDQGYIVVGTVKHWTFGARLFVLR